MKRITGTTLFRLFRRARNVTLIGRTTQLEILGHQLGQCLSGNGQVALVSGPVGAGKTELIHTFTEIAAKTGTLPRTATCTPAEQHLPFGVFSQLLPDAPLSPDLSLVSAARALTRCDTPLLIAVDDIQHADRPSLDTLFYIARRIGQVRVMLLLSEADGPRTPLHADLVRERQCHRVRVPPLSAPETSLLAGSRALEVHELTGGSPLLIHAVLDSGALREDLLACVHRSDPAVIEVGRALAVLGEFACVSSVSQLTGIDPAFVARVVETMSEAGLTSGLSLRHPLTAGFLLEDMARADRGDLHLRAARLLHERGVGAGPVAAHLACADRPLAAWAAPVLQDGAELALLDGAVSTATRYLELAARTATEDSRRALVRARLMCVEWHESPTTAARHFPALLADSRAGVLGERDAVSLLRQLLWHGRGPDAAAVLASMPASGAVRSWLACTHPRIAPAETGSSGNGAWGRATTALEAVLCGDGDGAVTVAEGVLQGARANGISDYRIVAVQTLTYAGELDSAARWCDQLLTAAERSRTLRAMLLACRAEISIRAGDLDSAAKHSAKALKALPRQAWGVGIGFPLSAGLLAAARSGRTADAAALAAIPVPNAMYECRAGAHYVFARGHHHLAAGRNHAALSDFLVTGEMLTSWGLNDFVPWRIGAADAYLRQGRRDQARELVGDHHDGAALRVLAACEDKRRKPGLLTRAIKELEEGDQYELAVALAAMSRVWQGNGDHRRARMTLRRAWHVAKTCGAHGLCEELLPGENAAATGMDALSDAERRVAALAATGHTNREIADKLFITSSTVEQHLTRVYRKLNVKYRTDLPAEVAAG